MDAIKLNAILKSMEEQNLPQMIISDPPAIFYLTGKWIIPGERCLALYLNVNGNHFTASINDKTLVEDINSIVNDYIGSKKLKKGTYSYTKKLKKVYDSTFKALKEEHKELKEEDFKTAYDKMEYPLDDEILEVLNKLVGDSGEIQYSKVKDLDKLWLKLIEKSINCLRFFDTREPFMLDGSKKSSAYGIDKLEEYLKNI